MIETISTSDEVSMVVSALSLGTITLIMDANASHVVHRCLQKLSPEYKAVRYPYFNQNVVLLFICRCQLITILLNSFTLLHTIVSSIVRSC